MNLIKKNIGYIITIVLFLLLTSFKIFQFLTNSILGRLLLISLVAFIACCNKFLGLVAVLAIIIAFNYNELRVVQPYNYYEGFESGTKEEDKKKANDAATKIIKTNTTPTKTTTHTAREGFCMSDRERNIQKGKQSNSIPVSIHARGNRTDNVSPSDKSVFSGLFSSVNL
jgi:hypothetical protein